MMLERFSPLCLFHNNRENNYEFIDKIQILKYLIFKSSFHSFTSHCEVKSRRSRLNMFRKIPYHTCFVFAVSVEGWKLRKWASKFLTATQLQIDVSRCRAVTSDVVGKFDTITCCCGCSWQWDKEKIVILTKIVTVCLKKKIISDFFWHFIDY